MRGGYARLEVFPTRVGVNLLVSAEVETLLGLPHTRGGEPG